MAFGNMKYCSVMALKWSLMRRESGRVLTANTLRSIHCGEPVGHAYPGRDFTSLAPIPGLVKKYPDLKPYKIEKEVGGYEIDIPGYDLYYSNNGIFIRAEIDK